MRINNIQVSTGSVSNILKEWRQQESKKVSNVKEHLDINESIPRVITSHQENISNPDISIENHLINNTQDSDRLEGGPLSWFMNGSDSEIIEPEVEKLKQDNNNDSRYKPSTGYHSSTGIGKVTINEETVESNPPKKIYPRNPSLEYKFEKDRIAFEYYGQAQDRIMKQISKEKDQRRHELFLIDQRKKKLEEWRKRLEERESNLNDRETRVFETEPFLSMAKQLQNLGISMEEVFSLIEIIREKAETENTDVRRAGINLAQEYHQFNGVQKQIERANQELALVDMTTIKKKNAITVLENLLNKGATQEQIIQLINLVDWDRYWSTSKGNPQQPNNSSNVNGNPQQPNILRDNGGPTMHDWLRLNLLSQNTTRQLNRIGVTH